MFEKYGKSIVDKINNASILSTLFQIAFLVYLANLFHYILLKSSTSYMQEKDNSS